MLLRVCALWIHRITPRGKIAVHRARFAGRDCSPKMPYAGYFALGPSTLAWCMGLTPPKSTIGSLPGGGRCTRCTGGSLRRLAKCATPAAVTASTTIAATTAPAITAEEADVELGVPAELLSTGTGAIRDATTAADTAEGETPDALAAAARNALSESPCAAPLALTLLPPTTPVVLASSERRDTATLAQPFNATLSVTTVAASDEFGSDATTERRRNGPSAVESPAAANMAGGSSSRTRTREGSMPAAPHDLFKELAWASGRSASESPPVEEAPTIVTLCSDRPR